MEPNENLNRQMRFCLTHLQSRFREEERKGISAGPHRCGYLGEKAQRGGAEDSGGSPRGKVRLGASPCLKDVTKVYLPHVLEAKTVERFNAAHFAQLNSYLRFSGLEMGLLLNFRVWPLKEGRIKRVINSHT